jgi:6-phosphogluconolactonase
MICRTVALLCCLLVSSVWGGEQRLYLAAGDALAVYRIDATTGELAALQKLSLSGAGPFTRSPDKGLLYAMAGKGKEASMATLRIEADGQLKLLHRAPVNLRAGYLRVEQNGRFIAGNHYGPGKATIWKLAGGIYRGETMQELTLEPKAHSSVFSPDNRWLLVPATGPNKVFINRFNSETGMATPNAPAFAAAPEADGHARQPRHLVFHPNGKIVYTTNEREKPGVGVWRWDAKRGILKPIQDIVTQPKDFEGTITTADLHLTPDRRYLYVSNRDITQRNAPAGRDSIVGFRIDPESGRLMMIGQTPCERHPRSFTIDSTGRFLYVAGQVDSRLGSYRINRKTGALTRINREAVGSRSSWVEVFELP